MQQIRQDLLRNLIQSQKKLQQFKSDRDERIKKRQERNDKKSLQDIKSLSKLLQASASKVGKTKKGQNKACQTVLAKGLKTQQKELQECVKEITQSKSKSINDDKYNNIAKMFVFNDYMKIFQPLETKVQGGMQQYFQEDYPGGRNS